MLDKNKIKYKDDDRYRSLLASSMRRPLQTVVYGISDGGSLTVVRKLSCASGSGDGFPRNDKINSRIERQREHIDRLINEV